jgi:hypothetical protein
MLLLGWIIWQAVTYSSVFTSLDWDLDQMGLLAVAVIAYVGTMVASSALSWLLLGRAVNSARVVQVISIYLVSQAGKYLPGNVGQHIGRVFLSKRAGIGLPQLLFVMFIEMVWVLGVAMAFAVVPSVSLGESFIPNGIKLPSLLTLSMLLPAAALAPYVFQRSFLRFSSVYLASKGVDSFDIHLPRLLLAFASVLVYAVGFLAMGLVMVLLASAIDESQASEIWLLSGLYAIAWVVGFITPGAPAGLGVRDTILLSGLTPLYGACTATGITVLLRLVTLSGDGLAYMVGLLLWRRKLPAAA